MTDLRFEAALDAALAFAGLDPVWRGNVRSLHEREDAAWRDKCCGGGCDPCVLQLARAVDELRRRLVG